MRQFKAFTLIFDVRLIHRAGVQLLIGVEADPLQFDTLIFGRIEITVDEIARTQRALELVLVRTGHLVVADSILFHTRGEVFAHQVAVELILRARSKSGQTVGGESGSEGRVEIEDVQYDFDTKLERRTWGCSTEKLLNFGI